MDIIIIAAENVRFSPISAWFVSTDQASSGIRSSSHYFYFPILNKQCTDEYASYFAIDKHNYNEADSPAAERQLSLATSWIYPGAVHVIAILGSILIAMIVLIVVRDRLQI